MCPKAANKPALAPEQQGEPYDFQRLLGQETEYAIRFSPRPPHASASAVPATGTWRAAKLDSSAGLEHEEAHQDDPDFGLDPDLNFDPDPETNLDAPEDRRSERRQRPGHSRVFHAFRHAIRRIVKTRPGEWLFFLENFFTENGGAFNYEALPQAPEGGLIEGATPECRGPLELVLYQRAQEALLLRAVPEAQRYLRRYGYSGELALIKNCRDAAGHIYGAQESYETEIAAGWRLWIYRVGAVLCLLPVLAWWGLYLLLLAVIVVGVLSLQLCLWASYGLLHGILDLPGKVLNSEYLRFPARWLARLRKTTVARFMRLVRGDRFLAMVAWAEYLLIYPVTYVILWPYARLLHWLAFRPERRTLSAFLISRPIISGAGTLLDGDRFALSEKATALRRIFRTSVSPHQRPLFDSGNLHKAFILGGFGLVLLRFDGLRRLFRSRVRLQIGMSDANRCQLAEYLKVGTMLLVMDAARAGYLEDAPVLKSPRRALKTITNDPGLLAKVRLRGGSEMTALELQRWYLSGVQRFLADRRPAAEPLDVARLWAETLDALERDPGKLIGRLDWVSKRYLLETAGRGIEADARKRIDIGYHELGDGFYDRLEREGVAPQLIEAEQVQAAIFEPSSSERAQLRSRLIRGVEFSERRVQISWNSVRVGYWWNQRVISLDEFRRERDES
ncbi:MAG: proteasome accessory factor PafA2 family protein [bacterium]|nr:proteasome accessory factor PafA2 family protein [bacterium]